MKKILREIFSIQNINNHKVISILGIKIKFALCRRGGVEYSNLVPKEDYKKDIIQEVNKILTKKVSVLEGKLRKITPKAYLEQFEVHVTDHSIYLLKILQKI